MATYKKISKDCNVSEPTIAVIMKKLQQNNFIKKIQQGVWFVNPNILMKGNDSKRQKLLSYYQSEEPIDSITFSRTQRPAIPEVHPEQIALQEETERGEQNNND